MEADVWIVQEHKELSISIHTHKWHLYCKGSSIRRFSGHWNLAGLLGISFLRTSVCRPTIFNLRSSIPALSTLRIPSE
jgi:hypothetical protein